MNTSPFWEESSGETNGKRGHRWQETIQHDSVRHILAVSKKLFYRIIPGLIVFYTVACYLHEDIIRRHPTHLHGCMSRLGDGPTGASALKLRWGKYSIAYQRRLLEGGRSLREFFDRKELDWNLVQRGKARVVDEILEQFVREKHADDRRSSLRVAKHGILWVQVIRPRLRHSL